MLFYASANPTRLHWSRRILCGCAFLAFFAGPPSAQASDPILLNADRYRVEAGRYSVFAAFQANLQHILDACGKGVPRVVEGAAPPGRIGPSTRAAIQRALECEALRDVPKDSPAHSGKITEALWRAVMPGAALPTVRQRAEAMVLSFEATDFGDQPEWNFCEDSKATPRSTYDPKAPGAVCYNESDPCSFLTWGPRGATAGQGREIQWILWLAWKSAPSQVERAFGGEFASVRRFFTLKGSSPRSQCVHGEPLERFMCAVWIDPARRKAWEHALVELGHSPAVRRAYAQLYDRLEFDGGKLRAYSELWGKLDLPVSEIDYAFFLDRITHQGGPQSDDEDVDVGALRSCLARETETLSKHGAARRCLARVLPHSTQVDYRLARDVAYYLDAYPEGVLNRKEIKAWAEYVPLSAVYNFALSDEKMVQIDEALALPSDGIDLPLPTSRDLTDAERNACPHDILFPVAPKRNR